MASKYCPPARVEKQAIKTGPTKKASLKKEKHSCKQSTIKNQKSNYGILLDLRKRSSKIGENILRDPQLY